MNSSFVIRPAKPDDAEQIATLRKRVDKDKANGNPPLDPYGGSYPTEKQQRSEITDGGGLCFVAVANQKIIGCAYCWEMYRRPGEYRLKFITDSEWRGMGVATALVLQIVDWSKQEASVNELICGFHRSHKAAKHVLVKFGFEVSHEGWVYFMQGARYDETEMTLHLR